MKRADYLVKKAIAPCHPLVARKNRLYLAGDVSNNDWRYELIPQLRIFKWGDAHITTTKFEYAGPYFASSTTNEIRSLVEPKASKTPDDKSHPSLRAIVRKNDEALKSADLVLAYITSPDCYQTLAEISRAATKKRRPKIVIVLSPKMSRKKFPKNVFGVDLVCYPASLSNLHICLRAALNLLQNDMKTKC